MSKVLLIVDMQHDFMPSIDPERFPEENGALPVPGGLDIVPNIVREAYSGYDKIIASRDFHPQTHISFKEVGGDWPMHCIAGTEGAQLLPEIDMVADIIISKGTDPNKDEYSVFQQRALPAILHEMQKPGEEPPEVVICGVATDVCVRATAFDCYAMGWKTTVLSDCVAGLAAAEDALTEMSKYFDVRPRG